MLNNEVVSCDTTQDRHRLETYALGGIDMDTTRTNTRLDPIRLLLVAALLVTSALTMPLTAFADDDEAPGEVMIHTPFQFVRFVVDDKAGWENHTFIKRHKTLHIFGLARDRDHTIVLSPRNEEGYESVTLTIKPAKFKRKRVRRDGERGVIYQQVFKIRFKKIAAKKPSKGKKKPPTTKKRAK